MLARVGALGDYFQVLPSVVQFVAIPVVYSLVWMQRASQVLLGHQAVLLDVRPIWLAHESITTLDVRTAFPSVVARTAEQRAIAA